MNEALTKGIPTNKQQTTNSNEMGLKVKTRKNTHTANNRKTSPHVFDFDYFMEFDYLLRVFLFKFNIFEKLKKVFTTVPTTHILIDNAHTSSRVHIRQIKQRKFLLK